MPIGRHSGNCGFSIPGNVSVFEKGWATFKIFSSAVARFTVYGVGGGSFVLVIAAYSVDPKEEGLNLWTRKKSLFSPYGYCRRSFSYLLIFIHPSNPGYVLVFLPALFILTALSIEFLGAVLKEIIKRDLSTFICMRYHYY